MTFLEAMHLDEGWLEVACLGTMLLERVQLEALLV